MLSTSMGKTLQIFIGVGFLIITLSIAYYFFMLSKNTDLENNQISQSETREVLESEDDEISDLQNLISNVPVLDPEDFSYSNCVLVHGKDGRIENWEKYGADKIKSIHNFFKRSQVNNKLILLDYSKNPNDVSDEVMIVSCSCEAYQNIQKDFAESELDFPDSLWHTDKDGNHSMEACMGSFTEDGGWVESQDQDELVTQTTKIQGELQIEQEPSDEAILLTAKIYQALKSESKPSFVNYWSENGVEKEAIRNHASSLMSDPAKMTSLKAGMVKYESDMANKRAKSLNTKPIEINSIESQDSRLKVEQEIANMKLQSEQEALKREQESSQRCQQENTEYNTCLAEYNTRMQEYSSCENDNAFLDYSRRKFCPSQPYDNCYKPNCSY